MRKLSRSNSDRVFTGLVGGIGEYFDVDPMFLRMALVLLAIATGFLPLVIAYIVAITIVPEEHKIAVP